MTDLVEESQHLSERLFVVFRQAASIGSEISALANSMDTYRASILGSIPVRQTSSTELPEFVVVEEPDSPDLALMSVEYFRNLALKLKLQEHLTGLSGDLSRFAVGKTVKVMPVDGDSSIIAETYFSGGLLGTRQQERNRNLLYKPRKAVGTIDSVFPAGNLLRISPIRLSQASLSQGYYEVPVIDKNGDPQISVELREPGFRDKPGKYPPTALFDRFLRHGLTSASRV